MAWHALSLVIDRQTDTRIHDTYTDRQTDKNTVNLGKTISLSLCQKYWSLKDRCLVLRHFLFLWTDRQTERQTDKNTVILEKTISLSSCPKYWSLASIETLSVLWTDRHTHTHTHTCRQTHIQIDKDRQKDKNTVNLEKTNRWAYVKSIDRYKIAGLLAIPFYSVFTERQTDTYTDRQTRTQQTLKRQYRWAYVKSIDR